MGLFDNLTTSEKARIMEVQLSQLTQALWTHLIAAGIDPDSFDEETWSGPEEWMGPSHPARIVQDHLSQIALLKSKLAELR